MGRKESNGDEFREVEVGHMLQILYNFVRMLPFTCGEKRVHRMILSRVVT